jgi:hypothetical protein
LVFNTSIPQRNWNAEHDVLGGCDDFAHGGPFAPLPNRVAAANAIWPILQQQRRQEAVVADCMGTRFQI